MTVLRVSLVLLLVAIGGLPSGVWAQAPDSSEAATVSDSTAETAVVRRVVTAFSEGDAGHLLAPSAERVEISLFGTRTYYSSAQALYVLREFFRSHVPRQFFLRDVMETSTSCLVRGEYEQAHVSQRLQVYVRLGHSEASDPSWRLREVRIQEIAE